MNDSEIRLNVIALDFCHEFGEDEDEEDEEPKPKQPETKNQVEAKNMLANINSKIKGAIFPAHIAMEIYQ